MWTEDTGAVHWPWCEVLWCCAVQEKKIHFNKPLLAPKSMDFELLPTKNVFRWNYHHQFTTCKVYWIVIANNQSYALICVHLICFYVTNTKCTNKLTKQHSAHYKAICMIQQKNNSTDDGALCVLFYGYTTSWTRVKCTGFCAYIFIHLLMASVLDLGFAIRI